MTSARLAAALLLVLPLSARAETVLRLAETATVMVHPDQLDGALRVEATAASAAAAQRQVNAAMADALARAKQVPAATVSTGVYNVWHVASVADHPDRWQATQSLLLSSHDGAALLTLIGTLQQQGLAADSLVWRLSAESETAARAAATRQALASLRERVDAAAALLGLRFDSFREVRLDGVHPPAPMQRAMLAAVPMAAALPPSAAAADIAMTATAEADAVLVPR